jgi:hypothetical protein
MFEIVIKRSKSSASPEGTDTLGIPETLSESQRTKKKSSLFEATLVGKLHHVFR